ncbi:hypothetical protein GU926_03950 [Nibribacter ruber]|uniref:Protein FecR C-terminal domain-containing protein n=1 Tax=Nibribacter ruber TaxID=2698458 RepID=A0A6P1NSH4_9BACT|nr:TonB-dependent receptor [Nibribacter ruber]QHL86637.1 hypothetical protein GU926_03950 [Nibribacter ruber]
MGLPPLFKLSIFCLLLLLFTQEAAGQKTAKGKAPKISFDYQNTPLSQVLQDLEQRYSLNFSFSNEQVDVTSRVTCATETVSLQKALRQLTSCLGLSYQLVGEQVVLRRSLNNGLGESAKPYTQNIRGTVVDAAIQTPLIGATVILVSESPIRAVTTREDGSFLIPKVSIGRHILRITYIGYQEAEISNLLVVAGKEAIVSATLEESLTPGMEIVIEAESDKSLPQNQLIVSSVHTLRTDEINRFAGSRQDPSRMAANYAGVLNASDQRNDLIVRGNSPLGVLWRLEGVEIPNPNHFTFTPNTGGAFSLLNNNLLASSDFLTGAFPAEYGNRIGAVMDVKMRTGNNQKFENTLQIGLNGLEMVTEGPLIGKWGGSFLGSMRLFTFQPLEKLGVDIGFNGLPKYQDGSFKIELPTPKAGTFTLWGIGGTSNITVMDFDPDTTTWGKVRYRTEHTLTNRMFATGLRHTFTFSPKTVSEFIISSSGSQVEATNTATFRNRTTKLSYYLRNYEQQFISRLNVTHKASQKLLFKTGLSWQKMYYNNQEIVYYDLRDVYEIPLDAQGSASILQGYGQARYSFSPMLDVQVGLYSQLFSIGGKWSIEPRISASYYLTDEHRIYLAAGLHSQTQPLVYYEYKFFNPSGEGFNQPYNKLDFTRSSQVVAGYNYNISTAWRFKTEVFFQKHYRVPVSKRAGEEAFSMLNQGTEYNFVTVDSVVSEGYGRNYGIELTLERFLKKGFYALGNVTLMQSWFTGGDGKERPTTFSVGYISNILIGKEFQLDQEQRHLLSLDVRFNLSGGRRFIPIDVERTINEPTDKVHYDVANAFLPQLKPYFRSDVRLSYQLNTRKTTHWIYAAADNFLNTKNELYYSWDLEENKAKIYYQLGIYPYLGYRIQF